MPQSADRRPILAAWKQAADKRQARQARAKARQGPETKATLGTGAIVEIAGKAEVNHTEADGARTLTDHRDALARVETGYYSHERKERMAVVRTEDNRLRAIPEHRLKPVSGADAPRPARATSVSLGGHDGWERAFGKRSTTDELVRLGKIKA